MQKKSIDNKHYGLFEKSKIKNKKYKVEIYDKETNKKEKTIHFGDKRYEQFLDKLKQYSDKDHKDNQRRKQYYQRHGETNNIFSAKYYSNKYLW